MNKQYWVIAGVIIIIALLSTNFLSLVTDTTFVKPLWARLECAKDDVAVTTSYSLAKGPNEIKCGSSEFTDRCEIQIKADAAFGGGFGSLIAQYQLCDSSTGNCGAFNSISIGSNTYTQLPTLTKGQSYVVKLSNILGASITGSAKKIYYPYRLVDFYDGGKAIVNSYNCNVPSSALNRILAKDNPSSSLQMGAWYNYVHDWVYGPASNVFSHMTYGQVYCTGHNIYSIVTLKAADNSILKLNPSYSSIDKEGRSYQGLGNLLSSVECCPNEPNCGDDFKYNVNQIQECTTDAQCITTPVAKTSTSYQIQLCQSNKCVWQTPVIVECMNNGACPNGKICDLAVGSTQFKCIGQSGTSYCGDNKCDVDESQISCPNDCGIKPISNAIYYWIIGGLLVVLIGVIYYTRRKR